MAKKLTGSDLLNLSLKAEGVDTLFGIAGDHILDMLDRMLDEPFRMIDTRHESGAVHAADAYARILRRASVALIDDTGARECGSSIGERFSLRSAGGEHSGQRRFAKPGSWCDARN